MKKLASLLVTLLIGISFFSYNQHQSIVEHQEDKKEIIKEINRLKNEAKKPLVQIVEKETNKAESNKVEIPEPVKLQPPPTLSSQSTIPNIQSSKDWLADYKRDYVAKFMTDAESKKWIANATDEQINKAYENIKSVSYYDSESEKLSEINQTLKSIDKKLELDLYDYR